MALFGNEPQPLNLDNPQDGEARIEGDELVPPENPKPERKKLPKTKWY